MHADTIAWRRHLHQYPELSFEEAATSRYVAACLTELGIPYQAGWAGHGIVAHIQGQQAGGRVIALRADMDALPIAEANAVSYQSKHEGIMHACGHDVHTSSLMGTARILQEMRAHFSGTVKLVFQPGEEKNPGGASIMLREGALADPAPLNIMGQHVHPPLEVGKVGFRPGMAMASADELYLTVTGRGGHGALPHNGIDPIVISAQLIVALQTLISRRADPILPSVLTFGYIASDGGATNIIPDQVYLKGTFRTMDEEWRHTAHHLMHTMVTQLAESMGGQATLRIDVGYPALINDPALTARARQYATDYLGAENVVELPIRMTAEDFAYYSQVMPACFYRLGTGNAAKGITSPVHTNTFDVDEDCLRIGSGLMAWMAISELKGARSGGSEMINVQ